LSSKKGKFWKILLILFFGLAVIVAWLGFGERGLIKLYRTEKERQTHINQINKLAEENRLLREEVHRLRTDMGYVEYVARKQLNMIKPNEVIYRFKKQRISDNGVRPLTQIEQHDRKTEKSEREVRQNGEPR